MRVLGNEGVSLWCSGGGDRMIGGGIRPVIVVTVECGFAEGLHSGSVWLSAEFVVVIGLAYVVRRLRTRMNSSVSGSMGRGGRPALEGM